MQQSYVHGRFAWSDRESGEIFGWDDRCIRLCAVGGYPEFPQGMLVVGVVDVDVLMDGMVCEGMWRYGRLGWDGDLTMVWFSTLQQNQ